MSSFGYRKMSLPVTISDDGIVVSFLTVLKFSFLIIFVMIESFIFMFFVHFVKASQFWQSISANYLEMFPLIIRDPPKFGERMTAAGANPRRPISTSEILILEGKLAEILFRRPRTGSVPVRQTRIPSITNKIVTVQLRRCSGPVANGKKPPPHLCGKCVRTGNCGSSVRAMSS